MTQLAELGIKIESGDIRAATRDLGRLEIQGGKVEKATDGMTSSMKTFAVASAAAAAAAAGMIARAVIDRHRELTSAISDLSAITGATGKDLQFYNEQARQIGSTTTLSATQAAEAFKLIASAKPDLLASKEALAAVTREVVTLAEASGLAMPEAASAVGSALNQFGAGAEEASRFVNVLAAGAKFGASEINETAQALKVVGTVASSAGLSFEETNAAIQALASVSLKGSEAGTGLRGVLLKLSIQSRDEFNPEIVGLSKAMQNLSDANLTTAEKAKLFGQESITAANALIKEAGSLDTLTGKLTGTSTAMEQATIRTDNLDGDMERMGAAWEDVALTLGETFDPVLRATVQSMEVAAKIAKTLSLAISDMGDALGAYAAVSASILTLDFDGAKAIMKAREEQFVANDKAVRQIWEEKKAIDALNESKAVGGTTETTATGAITPLPIVPPAELSDKETEALQTRLARLQEHYATEKELALIAFNEKATAIQELEDAKIGTDAEREELRLQAAQEYEDRLLAIKEKSAADALKAEERANSGIQAVRQTTYSQGVALLQKFAGDNKAIAAILIAIQTAKAVKDIQIQATAASAQVMAYGQVEAAAHAAMLNYPAASVALSKAAASAASIQANAAVSSGIAVASGIAEFASLGSSSGSSPQPGVNTSTNLINPATNQEQAPRTIQQSTNVNVSIQPGIYSQADIRNLIEGINEEIGNGVELRVAA